ncbi:DUF4139 domain-containing protein [Marinobacterium jannaschii]|uniref:DUF4139 domain-containing protein n=1 Tax=Marinobacterium jannaschii TaxID=64970 RepID=UPI000481FA61|nr:DUF4139 domain-containing protein [Marinobacterium jannaschii]
MLIPFSRNLITASLLALLPTLASAQLSISDQQRQALSLTLYNQDLGLVREQRQLPVLKPGQQVTVEGVSRLLQPATLQVKNAGRILEQNLNTNLLNQRSLLQHYLGKELQLARTNPATGEETTSNVRLLSIEGNRALVERNGRAESIPYGDQWRFIFPAIPKRLLSRPSLNFRSGGTSQPANAQISYLSGGMNWGVDYVLTLNDKGDSISLDGLATLSNNTGNDFSQAEIQLLAGDLSQPRQQAQIRRKGIEMMAAMADSPMPSREQLADFHLYRLPGQYDLLDGQQKQVSLIGAEAIPVEREYNHSFLVSNYLDSTKHEAKPRLQLRFVNELSEDGTPLPGGNVRVFSPDQKQQLQFIGGSAIRHTASGEKVEVGLGRAFDVSISRKQTQFSKSYDGLIVEQQLSIRNSRNSPARVVINANFPQIWEMERSAPEYEKTNAGTARWVVEVPGKSESLIDFRAKLLKSER